MAPATALVAQPPTTALLRNLLKCAALRATRCTLTKHAGDPRFCSPTVWILELLSCSSQAQCWRVAHESTVLSGAECTALRGGDAAINDKLTRARYSTFFLPVNFGSDPLLFHHFSAYSNLPLNKSVATLYNRHHAFQHHSCALPPACLIRPFHTQLACVSRFSGRHCWQFPMRWLQ
jgi:hypothetical protein